jgi:hypothetical protein
MVRLALSLLLTAFDPRAREGAWLSEGDQTVPAGPGAARVSFQSLIEQISEVALVPLAVRSANDCMRHGLPFFVIHSRLSCRCVNEDENER